MIPRPLVLLFVLGAHLLAGSDLPAAGTRWSVRDFGATGDGRTLDTAAINAAIAAAADAGGGSVEFPAGEYLSHSVRLRSRITLVLGAGATLIAADPPRPGETGGYDPAEPNAWTQYQDFGHSHWHNSLIWGEDLEDVAIIGPGRIYGRGLSRGNGRVSRPVGAPPPPPVGGIPADVLAADGEFEIVPRPDLVPGPFNYPNARDTLPPGTANKAIALKNCRNVILRDFSILHGGHFAILATGVDNLLIDGLLIDTNRDGIDIDSCSNVRVSNTSVNSPWDDGICLKASHALGVARACENVTIVNCFVSGYDEGTLLDGTRRRTLVPRGGPIGRIKLGTEAGGGFRNIAVANCVFDYCRGIALEQVDGAVLEDIAITNITMRDVQNAPLFIRLGARLRRPETSVPGQVRRILVSNLVAYNVAPEHGVLIAGLEGHPIEDVVLENVMLHFRGGGTAAQAAREVPELAKAYPDPYEFGTLPAWGIFARHVANLQIRGLQARVLAPDARPAVLLEGVAEGAFRDIRIDASPGRPAWSLKDVAGLHVRDVTGLPDGAMPPVGTRTLR